MRYALRPLPGRPPAESSPASTDTDLGGPNFLGHAKLVPSWRSKNLPREIVFNILEAWSQEKDTCWRDTVYGTGFRPRNVAWGRKLARPYLRAMCVMRRQGSLARAAVSRPQLAIWQDLVHGHHGQLVRAGIEASAPARNSLLDAVLQSSKSLVVPWDGQEQVLRYVGPLERKPNQLFFSIFEVESLVEIRRYWPNLHSLQVSSLGASNTPPPAESIENLMLAAREGGWRELLYDHTLPYLSRQASPDLPAFDHLVSVFLNFEQDHRMPVDGHRIGRALPNVKTLILKWAFAPSLSFTLDLLQQLPPLERLILRPDASQRALDFSFLQRHPQNVLDLGPLSPARLSSAANADLRHVRHLWFRVPHIDYLSGQPYQDMRGGAHALGYFTALASLAASSCRLRSITLTYLEDYSELVSLEAGVEPQPHPGAHLFANVFADRLARAPQFKGLRYVPGSLGGVTYH